MSGSLERDETKLFHVLTYTNWQTNILFNVLFLLREKKIILFIL